MVMHSLAGNSLQSQTVRIRSRQLAVSPKKIRENPVRLHRCFVQTFASVKPKRCKCREYLPYSDAVVSVQRGNSEWLLVLDPKKETLVPYYGAIVVRATKTERAEQVQQLKTYSETEKAILKKFRNLVLKAFAKGNLPQAAIKISDAELRAYLGTPETLRKNFPEFGANKLWAKVLQLSTDFWTNHTDAPENLSDGEYLTEAPRGKGRIVTGGYDLPKLSSISRYDEDFAIESGNLNTFAKSVRPEGHGPDDYEREDYSNE
jgi:hypothetical protein